MNKQLAEENFNLVNRDYLKQEKLIQDLKKLYEREKIAIEAKITSATQLKQTIVKNTRVENKISFTDTSMESKLRHYDDTIRLNEEKRGRDIQSVRDKYESKMNIEINEINGRADKYHNYLVSLRSQLEEKKDNVIRDLSSNIIVNTIGDVFDEDAFPKLTKLKYDIEKEEQKLKELYNVRVDASNKCRDAIIKDRQNKLEEAKEEERRENDKLEEAKRMKLEEQKMAKAAQNQREIARQNEKRQAHLASEAQQEQFTNWQVSVKKKLPTEYQRYISLMDSKTVSDEYSKLDVQEVVNSLDTIKQQLVNLQTLNKQSLQDNNYFKDDIWDMYYQLQYKQKLEIAQQNKLNQILLIKKYYDLLPKPEPEDDDEEE